MVHAENSRNRRDTAAATVTRDVRAIIKIRLSGKTHIGQPSTKRSTESNLIQSGLKPERCLCYFDTAPMVADALREYRIQKKKCAYFFSGFKETEGKRYQHGVRLEIA
jgi:hypothetical protein